MKARVLCPHCKVQGRLIRLTETSGDKLKCRHCGHTYTRDEIAIIYENAARAFAEAAAKVRKQPMKEPYATPVHKYPLPDPDEVRHWHIPERDTGSGAGRRLARRLLSRSRYAPHYRAVDQGGPAMNWTDDAYNEEYGPWTDEELMIAAANASRRKALCRETTEGDDDV